MGQQPDEGSFTLDRDLQQIREYYEAVARGENPPPPVLDDGTGPGPAKAAPKVARLTPSPVKVTPAAPPPPAPAKRDKAVPLCRAYSLFVVKAAEEISGERLVRGIATTPATDRVGDIVEVGGARFKLPLPLLWQHDAKAPVGHVIKATPSDKGIEVVARIAQINEPGRLKDRLDEAWQSLKIGLVRGLSIGFAPLRSEGVKGGLGERFLEWDWLELSCVTIPANAEANILSVKSADRGALAASGYKPPRIVRLTS